MTYEVRPEGKKPKVTFTSSDEDIVTVTDDGTVVGVGVGTATVTMTVKDDGSVYEWTIKVQKASSIWE